jgi:hypothetical protein
VSFDPINALVDGTFRNPAVLVAFVASSLLAGIAGWRVVRRWWAGTTPWRWRQYTVLVVALTAFFLLSPLCVLFLVNIASGVGPWSNVSLCLMPTHYFARDFGPGIVGFGAGVITAWRRERPSHAA